MRRTGGAIASWLLAAACAAPCPQAVAQTLDGVAVAVDGDDLVARVRFSAAVRLLPRSAPSPAQVVEFQIEPLAPDVVPAAERTVEARRIAATRASPAFAVVLSAAPGARTKQVTLQIGEVTQVRARPGSDPRTIEVVLVGKASPPRASQAPDKAYAIRLASGPASAIDSVPPVPSRFQDLEVFDSRVVADGVSTFQVHLGYFSSAADAEAARVSLQGRFPDAVVVDAAGQRAQAEPPSSVAQQPPPWAAATPALAATQAARPGATVATSPGLGADARPAVPVGGPDRDPAPAFGASPAPDEAPPPVPTSGPAADPSTQIVVGLRLNGVAKGDVFAYMTAERDILLPPDQLVAMGVANPPGRRVEIGGESHLSLKSIPGAELELNEKSLTLDLRLPPDMLPAQNLDLGAALPATPVQRRAPGGFLNYRFGHLRTQDGAASYNGTTELGLNVGQLLLLDNRNFTNAPGQRRAVRLQTQLIHDQPEALRRWTFGDFFASSGELGSALNLGGISVSKLYQINPYFVRTPLASYAGTVSLPSTVDVYLDGARVRSDRVAPGTFSFQNLSAYNAAGLRTVEVVIKDAFGREERFSFPHFFTDQLLAKGLHEYSYNVGWMRRNFGVTSNDYGGTAVSAFHRYGLSDLLTVGLGGDATRNHVNLGARVSINTVQAGVVSAGVFFSRDRGEPTRSGTAASLDHSFQLGPFNSQLVLRRYSEDYAVLGFSPAARPRLLGSASISYGSLRAGSFSLSHGVQTVFGGATDQHTTTLGYTKMLGQHVALTANLSRVVQETSGYAAFVGLSFLLGNDLSVNASHQKPPDGDTASQLQLNQTAPVGEGLGYHVFAQRTTATGATGRSISPFVQYNARHAILTAEGTNIVDSESGSSGSYQLSVAGSAAFIGNDVYFSRPVSDSFAVARIEPPLAGVRVLRSHAEVGVTGAGGTVFVPNLGSYQVNDVAVQPKDIPIDYAVTPGARKVRPPLRAGVLVPFSVRRIRALTGSLKFRDEGSIMPIEDREVVLSGAAGSARASTIRGGEFYIENLAPGRYAAQLTVEGKACRLELDVPDSPEVVAELGDVFCDAVH